MKDVSLNLLIPAAVIASCAIFVFLNLLIALRKRFSISVNCWFCNTNTRVPYKDRNSFVCPFCLQFNGFSEDGDYTREIPEQYSAKYNQFYCQRSETKLPPSNGLCDPCNRNQEMKVIQLSNFRARCEARFDEEIEEYRQKLEDSYQLCAQCQRHLNKTLNRVKTKLIGSKISKLTPKVTIVKDYQIPSRLMMIAILALSFLSLLKDFEVNLDFLRCDFYYHLVALRLTVMDLLGSSVKSLDVGSFRDIDSIATCALLLNSSMFFKQKRLRLYIISSMLFWSMKMLLSEVESMSIPAVKGSIATILVFISLAMLGNSFKSVEPTMDANTSFRKIQPEVSEDSDNDMELSDFDARSVRTINSFSSFRDSTIIQPSRTFEVKTSPVDRTASMTLNRTFGKPSPTIDLLSNHSFSIRKEVSTADRNHVNRRLDNLNISGGGLLGSTSTLKDFGTNKTMNPFALENSRCGSPTPSIASVFSGAQRSQIITPPRLEPSYTGEASWVGGGYWSSPQKRCSEMSYLQPRAEMSRSSSQSSGLGTIVDSDRNSRENSIGRDDVPSIFSEPVRRRNIFDRPSDSRSLFGQSFTQPPRANNFFLNTTESSFRKYRDNSFYK